MNRNGHSSPVKDKVDGKPHKILKIMFPSEFNLKLVIPSNMWATLTLAWRMSSAENVDPIKKCTSIWQNISETEGRGSEQE